MRIKWDSGTVFITLKVRENNMIKNKLSPWVRAWHHSNDCKPQGCPVHSAMFTYHSVTESFTFDFGDGTLFSLDNNQLELMQEYIAELTEDADDYGNLPFDWNGGEFYK